MARIPRMLMSGEQAVYHVMSRTALQCFTINGTNVTGLSGKADSSFKSVIVENGDLNPVRAGIADRPEGLPVELHRVSRPSR